MATVLVVDDLPMNRKVLAALLAGEGHRVLEAKDGVDGLRLVREARPGLVIADLLMPTMDGFEFARQLRADDLIADTPVIFATAAYNEREASALARDCGVRHILTKPLSADGTLDVVRKALAESTEPGYTAPYQAFQHDHLRLMTDKLSEKVGELEAVRERLAGLIETGRELALEHDPEQLLQLVLRSGREIVGAAAAVVGRVGAGGRVTLVSRGIAAETTLSAPSLETGIVAEALRLNGPRRELNPGGDPLALGLPADHPPVHSVLVVPLASPTRTYGWLGLRNKLGECGFSSEDERLATSLAAQAAVAYENALRYAEIERHAREMTERVAERTRDLERSYDELEQHRQQQLAIKDQFLSHVSHELRSPLNSIYQFVTILLDGLAGELTPDQRDHLDVVLRSTNQLRGILADLREAFRAQVGKLVVEPTRVSPVELIADALAVMERAAGDRRVSLLAEFSGYLPPVYADAARTHQVLVNLLDNAIKFTPEDGSVTVSVRIAPSSPGEVRVDVHDTGCGISVEAATRIFERLYQENPADNDRRTGLGLGLFICRKLIEQQNGKIWLEASSPAGSTFSFTLPRSPLSDLLGASFTGPDATAGGAALVAVDVALPPGCASVEAGAALRHAWHALASGVESGEVCLPRGCRRAGGETFFVVLGARGAEERMRRLQADLASWQRSENRTLELDICLEPLALPSASREPAMALAAVVEERITHLVKGLRHA